MVAARLRGIRLAAAICALALLLSCGGKSRLNTALTSTGGQPSPVNTRPVNPADPSADTMAMLGAQLEAELAKLGKTSSAVSGHVAPTGGDEVNDLTPLILDADGNGAVPPYGVSLRWAERLLGDYDQNGEVGLPDLTKLGQYLNYHVVYDAPELHNGIADIPSGDPEDLGDVGAGMPPAPDSGAFNWRLARIDGNRDGVIDIHDITPLAQHWHEAITGYSAYRQGPQDADFTLMTSGANPPPGVSIRRFDLLDKVDPKLQPFLPVLYAIPDFFILDPPTVGTQYKYKVAPFVSDLPANGPDSPTITVQPFDSVQSNEGVVPVVTATMLDDTGKPTGGPLTQIQGTVPFTLRFDASGSYIPGGKTPNYLWDFDGDGIFEVSSGGNPVQDHTFTENGRFDAQVSILLLDDANKATSSLASLGTRKASATGSGNGGQINITGNSPTGNVPPVAAVTADKQLGAIPLTVHFDASTSTDADGTVKFYEWDFNGDGTADFTSAQPTAVYSYGIPGQVNVSLKVTDDAGGFDTTVIPVIVSNADGNWPPSASVLVNPSFGAAPLDVLLDGSRSLDPDGQIVKYEWDLNGDFTFDIDTGPQAKLDYTFAQSGIYNVWLRITDLGGITALARTTVKVNTPPFGGLEASPLTGPGPLNVSFDASASLDLDGTIVKYEWDFDGDGVYDQSTGTVSHVTKKLYKIGKQTVTVRLTDNLGFTGFASVEINVLTPKNNLTPLATLTASPTTTGKPQTVTLTAIGSDPDPDGSVDHYDWDFEGDGVIDDQTDILNNSIQHTYNDYGLFHATVWVVDNVGSSTPATADVKIWDGTNEPPTAKFTVNPTGGPPSTPLNFSAVSSTDPENAISTYAWDFNGDGTVDVSGTAAQARDVQHSFAIKGTYNVILRITDAGGASGIVAKKVVVGDVPTVKCVADHAYAELPNATFSFDASRSQGVDGQITSFEWDLDGDGVYELSTGVSPFASVTFQLSDLASFPGGVLTPHLRVTNEIGAVTEVTQVQMPALDANGQPERDNFGNLLLDPDGGVKLMDVTLHLKDDYEEVENNETFQTSNWLIGTGPDGKFRPGSGGDSLAGLQPGLFSGAPVNLSHNDAVLGNYVEASLGQRNLGEYYDGDDDDWYAFKLAAGAHIRADLQIDTHGSTDPISTSLIMRLYGANGIQTLAQNQTVSGAPTSLDYDFRDEGIYYIRINRFVGQGQDYKLFLHSSPLPYSPETEPDTNNASANADNLHQGGGTSGPLIPLVWGQLNKNGGDSVDWYKFSYASAVTVRVQALFAHSLGDIDLFLYDQNLNLLGYSNSADDDESIWRSLPAPGGTKTVFIKVVAVSGGETNYNLTVGYPAGAPTNLTAADGSANGKIHITWSAPVGGNAPNGYDLYVSDSQFGIYTKLAANLTTLSYDHDLTATANVPLQNKVFWYAVKSTRTGEQDSDYSNLDSGFVNGIKAAVGLTADDSLSLDNCKLYFYSSPSDPALGTGNFGIPPVTYRLYADPATDAFGNNRPKTLIASFAAASGEDTLIPALGGLPARPGKIYRLTFDGAPPWSATELRGLNINFTVDAEAAGYASVTAPNEFGSIAGLAAPTNFSATVGLFTDKVRIAWSQPTSNAGIYPDGYVLQYAGEFDGTGYGGMNNLAWTDITQQPIPFVDGQFNYTFYDTVGGGSPPARKYRIRAVKTGITGSPFTPDPANGGAVIGAPGSNGLQIPSYGDWYVDSNHDVQAYLNQAPVSSIQPLYWTAFFWRHDVPGGWRGWHSFDREATSRSLQVAELSYLSGDTRTVTFVVAFRDPTAYFNFSPPSSYFSPGGPPVIADGNNGEGGSGPTVGGLSYSNGWTYQWHVIAKNQSY
jgi:PKD repeat protein